MPTVRTQQTQGGGGNEGGAGAQQGGSGGGGSGQRTTFRPPWIKDGPEPLPMPAAPWTLARARDRRTSRDEPGPTAEPAPVRKQSKVTIVPSQPSVQPNSQQENGLDTKGLRKDVIGAANAKKNQESVKEAPQEKKINIQVESKQRPPAPKEAKMEPKESPLNVAKPTPKAEPPKAKEPASAPKPAPKEPPPASKPAPQEAPRPRPPEPTPLSRSRSNRSQANLAPLPPPMPPPAPPPPDFQKSPLSQKQAAKVEALRTGRSRKRPDWSAMMKEVEHGLKLKHVQCNDRSAPLLSASKVKGQFMYDSEKPNVHNLLLREIQSGVKLKRVQCNDRSRPVLQGLRKFRRQLTIEEQQQQAATEPEAVAVEELDDIDSLRDDLQSTKQMLALELRNKEAVEKENKRLQARILNLEVEVEEERKRKAAAPAQDGKRNEDQKAVESLRGQLSSEQKKAHDLEQKVHEADLQMDLLRAELEEMRRRNTTLERRVSNVAKEQPLTKQPSAKKLARSTSNVVAQANGVAQQPQQQAGEEEEEETETEEEEETESEEEEDSSEDEEKAAALREKRQQREMKLLSTKVRSLKEKQDTARNERRALRHSLRNQTQALRDEKKKFRKLQKEVDKMAKLMKEDEDEDEDEEEEEEEEAKDEEEEQEEESEESSTDESEDEDSEGELPADSPFEDRKKNFTERAKRHENMLSALKKGNYLLKANVEKIKDDLFKQKELSLSLQEDLNSVLAELG